MTENDEEEEEGTKVRGRPNAYFASLRDEVAPDPRDAVDTYGATFRGVPAPGHGGSQHVQPEETLGSADLCWCGLPKNHLWPGKAFGAKHPKEGIMSDTHIDRRVLTGYNRKVADLVIQAVNHRGLRYRLAKNSLILYPNDDSRPFTVYARATDKQLRDFGAWYTKHAMTDTSKAVQPETVAALAAQVNNPEEHPPPKKEKAPVPAPPKAEPPSPVTGPDEDEWVPYLQAKDGEPHEFIQQNGKGRVRCGLCVGTETAWEGVPMGVGGHVRMRHTDKSDLFSEDAINKRTETRRLHNLQAEVSKAIDLLVKSVDYKGETVYIAELEAEIQRLKAENQQLRKDCEAGATAVARANEAEARLALIQEAFQA